MEQVTVKNQDRWKPTKFVGTRRGLRASRDTRHVFRGSRYIADMTARVYETMLQKYASGVLLDLGCGNAPLYGVYRSSVKEIICIDWDHENPYLDAVADLNDEIPLEDCSVDTILCSAVLEHIRNPRLLFSEMNRVLRPGGNALISVPFFYWLHATPFDYYRYSEYALRDFCKGFSWEVRELSVIGGPLEVLGDVTAKMCGNSRAYHLLHCFAMTFLKCFLRNMCKVRQANGCPFPLVYFLVARK